MSEKRPNLVSPNELLAQGIILMLDGYPPETKDDWSLLVNFFVVNTPTGISESVCRLMKLIYDIPLSDQEIKDIVRYQHAKLN